MSFFKKSIVIKRTKKICKFEILNLKLNAVDYDDFNEKEFIRLSHMSYNSRTKKHKEFEGFGLASKIKDNKISIKFLSDFKEVEPNNSVNLPLLLKGKYIIQDINVDPNDINIEIENLNDFISISLIELDNSGNKKLYRGQADYEWGLQPSIFRNDSNKSIEKDIYKELNQINHKAFFSEEDFIQIAVNMQHYGIPTRLLDWTSNALHSIYFACVNKANLKKDGAIYLIYPEKVVDIASEEEKDIVMFLKHKYLGREDKNVVDFFLQINRANINHYFFKTKYFNERIKNQKGYFLIYFDQNEEITEILKRNLIKELKRIFSEESITLKSKSEELIKEINKLPPFATEENRRKEIEVLVGKILEDIKPIDFREEGDKKKEELKGKAIKISIDMHKNVIRGHKMDSVLNNHTYMKIRIPSKIKETLINQLDDIGINSSTVYPDIEGLAKYLNEKYIK